MTGRNLPSDPSDLFLDSLVIMSGDGSMHSVLDSAQSRSRTIGPAIWSPDGQKVAYSVSTTTDSSPRGELWIVELSSGAVTKLSTDGSQFAWGN